MELNFIYVRNNLTINASLLVAFLYLNVGLGTPVRAAEEKKPEGSAAEQVDVEGVKKKYWSVGDEARMSVVQDRYYTKSGKIELGAFGGFYYGDPFYNTRSFGGLVGYHFSEYLGAKAIGWVDSVSDSSALTKFRSQTGFGTNSNATQSYFGMEGVWSPIYGKLSLLGDQIVYFDMHGSLGAGVTNTENGSYMSLSWGVGQQIFLAKSIAFGVDFRWVTFEEEIIERNKPAPLLGTKIDEQRVYNTAILLGLYLFL